MQEVSYVYNFAVKIYFKSIKICRFHLGLGMTSSLAFSLNIIHMHNPLFSLPSCPDQVAQTQYCQM